MSLLALLTEWRRDRQFVRSVSAWRKLPASPPRLASFPAAVDPRLVEALRRRGINQLYTHQHAAWRLTQARRHSVVVTATASGKTLCYNLPVVDCLLREPEARALYLFPTKALAQDQADELRQLMAILEEIGRERPQDFPPSATAYPIATYDGDTPSDQRPSIRRQARIVITNPDMLHTGILPHHTLWARFFQSLRYVVIDELHTLRGVFGSHVANVIRRLKRVARFYGSDPLFMLTSATIANPVELAERMIEADVSLIADNGAPRGEKHFIIFNPPVVNRELGLRRSALIEGVRLANQLLNNDVQTIVFARSRPTTELLLNYLRQARPMDGLAAEQPLRGYRGGYLPRMRREIERGLREGHVRGVVATNALELGVDIGQLGASVLVGYPGSISATWQQAGRAGRTKATSLALLIVSAAPVDQYLAHHPAWFFDRSPEHGLINPDNLVILLHHIRCAAFELPFEKGEGFGRVEGARVKELLDYLSDEGVLHRSNGKYFWMSEKYPAESVSLRSASPERVVIQNMGRPSTSESRSGDAVAGQAERPSQSDRGVKEEPAPDAGEPEAIAIGAVDLHSAYWMLHPQAIYMQEGQSYFVESLDLGRKIARVYPVDADYYTEASQEVTIELVEKSAEASARGARKAHGEVKVASQVRGFRKMKLFTHENLGTGILDLPPTELQTTAYWISIDDETVEQLRALGLWRADANDYGPNWQEMRARTRERDGFRCQNCGAREEGTQHHVHHKTPFKTFVDYRQANQLSNLVTLCSSCHGKVELAVRVRSGLAGLAFALGHLAPLFLMCDRRDLGVHSDPRSPLSSGRPTVAVYDNVPAGIGLSDRLYELHDELLARTHELIASCDCTEGCPSCVGPAGESGEGGKQETLALIGALSA